MYSHPAVKSTTFQRSVGYFKQCPPPPSISHQLIVVHEAMDGQVQLLVVGSKGELLGLCPHIIEGQGLLLLLLLLVVLTTGLLLLGALLVSVGHCGRWLVASVPVGRPC